jgi:prepilin-type N-terminal cleavage/methylation domain-containing protein
MKTRTRGFTLVELLVSITIIVTLLALLAPALDQAIYQAELVQCGTQMRAAAQGATTYAFDNKRRYMRREIMNSLGGFSHGLRGPAAFAANGGAFDDRPIHKGYIDLDWLVDPLTEYVDLNIKPDEDPNEVVYASNALYYGWKFVNPADGTGMHTLGDRWEAQDPRRGGARFAFPWLIADTNIQVRLQGINASHPDKRGLLVNHFAQAGDFDYGDNAAFQLGFNAALPITYSWWRTVGAQPYTEFDMNFASYDGHVTRLNDVENEHDGRIVHVPHARNEGSGGRWLNIAKP